MTEQLTARGRTPRTAPPRDGRSWTGVALAGSIALALSIAIFVLYFGAYPLRHLHLPMGFDPPYYVWRADYLGAHGVGTGTLASRPGYPILSAMLGSVTGRPQLELVSILSLVLVPLVSLAVGAFVVAGLAADRWGWAVAVAATGVVLGPTHLVGENLSNTLNLALELAALVPLAAAVAGSRRGFWAAVALLVAAGVAHWDFLAVFVVTLAVAVLLALDSSRREMASGSPFFRTEAGVLAGVGGAATAITGVLVVGVLRAPLVTIEVGEDRVLYLRKFVRDLVRLLVPIGAALAFWMVPDAERGLRGTLNPSPARTRRFARRIISAWTAVAVAGVLIGGLTLKVPPARFLALLVALPGAVGVAAAVAYVSRWVGRRTGSSVRSGRSAFASVVVAGVLLGGLAIPAVLRWYGYPVLLQEQALREAEVAGRYVGSLRSGQQVMFLVGYETPPFPYGPVLAERTIRIELPSNRQADVHFFVGAIGDLVAGRQTPPPGDRLGITTAGYRKDVRSLLANPMPVLVVRELAGNGFEDALALGARSLGPGVAVLRGPPLGEPDALPTLPRAVPSLGQGVLWGITALLMLAAAGSGWTRMFLSPRASPETFFSIAPAVGAAALTLGGLVAGEIGGRLTHGGGIITSVVVTITGVAAAALDRRRRSRSSPRRPRP